MTALSAQPRSTAFGDNLRSEVRAGCLVHGRLDALGLPAPIDCTIWDISQDGARLILARDTPVPDQVSISTAFSLEPRNAEVCWRARGEIGIKFIAGATLGSSADDRLRTIENRNAELLQQLRAVHTQLEEAERRASSIRPAPRSVEEQHSGRTRQFSYVLDDAAHILVVDDDPILREFARVHLTTPNASVELAESAEDGFEHLGRAEFDIALIDLEMPGMGGLEMIRRLRADPARRDLPIVVVTGREDMHSIDLAYEAGATSFVTKPVNWRLMSYQLRYVLRAQRSYRADDLRRDELALVG